MHTNIYIYITNRYLYRSRFERDTRNFAEMRMTVVAERKGFVLGKKITKITGCKTRRSIRIGLYVYNVYPRKSRVEMGMRQLDTRTRRKPTLFNVTARNTPSAARFLS